MPQSFSHIQNNIISKLKNAKMLRYSDLQVKGIPNDLFNYHLQFLVKKGYLLKSKKGYSLSELGVKHVADAYPLNNESASIVSLFKINVITLISRKKNGRIEILNQLRTSNPSFGKIGVPGGVVHKGESIEAAATRKLKVETGLNAQFKTLGIERRMMYVKDSLFSDVLFPIAYSDSANGELVDTQYGKNMWVPIAEAIKNETAEFDNIPAIIKVLKAIKTGKVSKLPFFYSENIQKGDQTPL